MVKTRVLEKNPDEKYTTQQICSPCKHVMMNVGGGYSMVQCKEYHLQDIDKVNGRCVHKEIQDFPHDLIQVMRLMKEHDTEEITPDEARTWWEHQQDEGGACICVKCLRVRHFLRRFGFDEDDDEDDKDENG